VRNISWEKVEKKLNPLMKKYDIYRIREIREKHNFVEDIITALGLELNGEKTGVAIKHHANTSDVFVYTQKYNTPVLTFSIHRGKQKICVLPSYNTDAIREAVG